MIKSMFVASVIASMAIPVLSSAQSAGNKTAPVQASAKEQMVIITTDYGTMKVKLYNETPFHRDNFLKLAKDGYFDDLLFHRVIKNFMIQGGDPESKGAAPGVALGNGGPNYTVPAEFVESIFHKKGSLAAARTGDNVNPKKESSGSQFYIVQGKTYTDEELNLFEKRYNHKYTDAERKAYTTAGGTPQLDRSYTVFGEVVEGLDVIDKIAAVKTAAADRPEKDVKMKVKIVN